MPKQQKQINVFIDTNILLSFYSFAKEDLETLSTIFASHKLGNAKVYLTQQVCDEFKRNREAKIKDAMARFKESKFNVQLPAFSKHYPEYSQILEASKALEESVKAFQKKLLHEVAAKNLQADALIEDIFQRTETIKTEKQIYERALVRCRMGNPPGKQNSIGDSINWLTLLEKVPEKEALHLISEDGDFYSILDPTCANPVLAEEWIEKKKSQLSVYRSLTDFMKHQFDGVAFAFDKEKEDLISKLFMVRSFASCHAVIAELEQFSYFSVDQVDRILTADVVNDQFGMIIFDTDVSDFLNRVAVPKSLDIVDGDRLEILRKVEEEKRNRV